jgi:hypothetical protein
MNEMKLHKVILSTFTLVYLVTSHLSVQTALAVPVQLAMEPKASGLGPFSDNDNNGWAFTVDSEFCVIGLSAYDVGSDGFGGDMLVTLWHHSSQTMLASAEIPAAGDGTPFPTVSITPVPLLAGEEYSVAAGRVDLTPELWDRWPNSDVTFFAPVSNARQVYGDFAGGFPSTNGGPRLGFTTAGGNFVIPEPATLCLLGLGGLALFRKRRA